MYIQLTLTELELLLPNSRELLLTGGGLFWILKIINPITHCHSQFLQWYSKVAQLSCDIIDKFRKMKCNTKKTNVNFLMQARFLYHFHHPVGLFLPSWDWTFYYKVTLMYVVKKCALNGVGGWHLHVNEYWFFSVWLNY